MPGASHHAGKADVDGSIKYTGRRRHDSKESPELRDADVNSTHAERGRQDGTNRGTTDSILANGKLLQRQHSGWFHTLTLKHYYTRTHARTHAHTHTQDARTCTATPARSAICFNKNEDTADVA
jgi:hypothetical protein